MNKAKRALYLLVALATVAVAVDAGTWNHEQVLTASNRCCIPPICDPGGPCPPNVH